MKGSLRGGGGRWWGEEWDGGHSSWNCECGKWRNIDCWNCWDVGRKWRQSGRERWDSGQWRNITLRKGWN